jgi:hypothetical protein
MTMPNLEREIKSLNKELQEESEKSFRQIDRYSLLKKEYDTIKQSEHKAKEKQAKLQRSNDRMKKDLKDH